LANNDKATRRVKKAGDESRLVADIKRKKAMNLKNVHGAPVNTDLASPPCTRRFEVAIIIPAQP